MKYIVYFILLVSCVFDSSGQTTIYSDPSGFTYTALPTGNDPIGVFNIPTTNVQNCTSLKISFEYSWSMDWIGSGNMEMASECGSCAGDPENPQTPNCINCWDFLYTKLRLDGAVVTTDLNSGPEQMGNVMMNICTNGATSLDVEFNVAVYSTTGAVTESVDVTNIVVMCWNATPTVNANPTPLCEGETLNLNGTIAVPADATSWMWTSTGTGTITNPSLLMTTATGVSNGDTYTLTTTDDNACTKSSEVIVTVNPLQDPTFSIADFCAPTSSAASGIVTPGGTFSFDPPPGDGATINSSTGVISNAVGGNSYSVKYTTPGPCPDDLTITVNTVAPPVGTLSGSAVLCPDQCATFMFNFASGNEPYTINLTASPPGFALPPIPGVTASQQFTICYMGSGPLPTIDMSTFTITIPTIFSGSGSLILTGISDGSGCPGNASGSFNLTLTNGPTAQPAGPLTACADANGDGIFNLSSLDNTVTGGNGSWTVTWYEDMAGTIPITNPNAYVSPGGSVYVSVNNGNCESSVIEVILNVETGMVPFIDMVCADSGLNTCDICLIGNTLDLQFSFGDGNLYTVTVMDISTSLTYTGVVSSSIPLSVPVTGSTTFELLSIQPVVGCPNFTMYGDQVIINVLAAPDIDPISIPSSCQPITLPPITGSNLTGSEAYFTGPNGTGTSYIAGDMIFASQTLYIYDLVAGCMDEELVVITINPLITINEIPDITACVSAVLPTISGTGLSANVVYNTNPLGSGTSYLPGSNITTTTTLYVFDPDADPNCLGNSVDLLVQIYPLPATPSLSSISCTGATGSVTITNPVGADYQYQLDGGTFQNSTTFSGLANGSHTIKVKSISTNCESVLIFSVACDCNTPATITMPQISGNVCDGKPFTLNNISFGGAANQVNLTTSGLGTLSPSQATISPFDFTYTPAVGEAGKTVIITLTTNDPDGNGPCAPEVATFALNVRNNPVATIVGDTIACKGGSILLTATGGLSYSWNTGSISNAITVPSLMMPTTTTVTVTDAFGCTATASKTITIRQITAGRDTSISFCKTTIATVNLYNYLSGDAMLSGIWKYGSDTIFNANTYIITDLPLGNNILRYIIDDPLCGKDTAIVNVSIRNSNNAGVDHLFIICQSPGTTLDFEAGIGNHDPGGTWQIVTNGLNLNISNPKAVSTANVNSGTYKVQYIIPNNGCASDTSVVTLDVKPFGTAGVDVVTSLCLGNTVDLLDLVKTTDLSGIIYNKNNHTGLSGTVWNTSGLSSGNFTFYYIIQNQTPCKPDTARIDIKVQATLNAGGDQVSSFCEGETLDLKSYLGANADPGGIFYYQNQVVLNGIFTPSGNATDFVFNYEVGDGILCPKVKSIITLKKIVKPTISLTGLNRICEGDCQTLILNTSSSFQFAYFKATDGQSQYQQSFQSANAIPYMLQICSKSNQTYNMTNWPANKTVTITLDSILFVSNGCLFSYDEDITFNTVPLVQKNVNPIICKSDNYTLNGVTFNTTKPTGTVTLPSINSAVCDTIANVVLSFYPDAVGNYSETFCDQLQTVTIGTETFHFEKPSGMVTLKGAAANGCDSIVNVNIKFEKTVVPGNYTFTTCDDTYTYPLGNKIFSKTNPAGTVLLSGAAAKGCDSLVNVNIIYTDFTITESLIYKCDGSAPTLELNLASSPGPYIVTLDGNIIGQPSSMPFSASITEGQHTVEVTSSEGCKVDIKVDVENSQGPIVNLSQTPNVDGTVQIITTAPQNVIYDLAWTPASSLSCNNCYDPIANPTETTTYTLNYLYGNQCPDSKQITIERINTNIIFPDIINPNSGNGNHSFYVQFPDKVTGLVKSMKIYDRWGNLVFFAENKPANSPTDGWTGEFGSQIAVPGVYVYLVSVKIDGKLGDDIYSGSVTLIR